MESSEATFEQCKLDAEGTVYIDRIEDGVRFVILRGPCSLCAYLGVPLDHPLAGHDYDNLPLECHGGLTFAGDKLRGLDGRYWYGWDYAHCNDAPLYVRSYENADRQWTPKDVDEDSWSARYGFVKLVKLAEAIARRK